MNSFLSQFILPSPRRLQPWEKEYFRHLEAEWAVLNIPADDVDATRINDLIARFADVGTRGEVHRNDLLEFEQTLLRHRSLVSLVQIAPVLRQRFHDVAGDRVFSAYRPTEMPDCAKANEEAHTALYDDLATVVSAIHWRYILFPFNSQIRTTLTLQALLWILAYTAIWAVSIRFISGSDGGPFLALFITCIFSGVLGGFISALRRMQSVGDDNDSVFVIQGIRSARFWLWFSPLLGGVFAVIALLFFVSGFLGGTVFPDFTAATTAASGAAAGTHWWFWQNLVPSTPGDYAKLFLWCFIAGFAERLIPDMIDNLVTKADPSHAVPTPSTPVQVAPTKAATAPPELDPSKSAGDDSSAKSPASTPPRPSPVSTGSSPSGAGDVHSAEQVGAAVS